jgi:hypothetical protein
MTVILKRWGAKLSRKNVGVRRDIPYSCSLRDENPAL